MCLILAVNHADGYRVAAPQKLQAYDVFQNHPDVFQDYSR